MWALPAWQAEAAARAFLDDPTSQVARVYGSDGHSMTDHLLMMVVDRLQDLTYLLLQIGGAKPKRPSYLSPFAAKDAKPFGVTELPPEEVFEILARMGNAPPDATDDEGQAWVVEPSTDAVDGDHQDDEEVTATP